MPSFLSLFYPSECNVCVRTKCSKVSMHVSSYLLVVVEKRYFLSNRQCVSSFPAPFHLSPSERPVVDHTLKILERNEVC